MTAGREPFVPSDSDGMDLNLRFETGRTRRAAAATTGRRALGRTVILPAEAEPKQPGRQNPSQQGQRGAHHDH
jgi:hypothetical protein